VKAFQFGVDAIRTTWSKIKDAARIPVKFVVDTVYNSGIVPLWNAIATRSALVRSAVEIRRRWRPARLHARPGRSPGALSGGEAVMRPEWTRAVGPGYVHTMNAAARSGGVPGVRGALAFADGGIVPAKVPARAGGPFDAIVTPARKSRKWSWVGCGRLRSAGQPRPTR